MHVTRLFVVVHIARIITASNPSAAILQLAHVLAHVSAIAGGSRLGAQDAHRAGVPTTRCASAGWPTPFREGSSIQRSARGAAGGARRGQRCTTGRLTLCNPRWCRPRRQWPGSPSAAPAAGSSSVKRALMSRQSRGRSRERPGRPALRSSIASNAAQGNPTVFDADLRRYGSAFHVTSSRSRETRCRPFYFRAVCRPSSLNRAIPHSSGKITRALTMPKLGLGTKGSRWAPSAAKVNPTAM
jgi:hypothetical protein